MKEVVRQFGLNLLAKREYSVKEFAEKLCKKFPDKSEEIRQVIPDFIAKKWLSDERCAESLIHDSILISKSGPQKIIQKLQRKGIDQELAWQSIEEFYPEEGIATVFIRH